MEYKCSVCGDSIDGDLVQYINHTESHIFDEIQAKHPEWKESDGICPKCVDYYRSQIKGEAAS